MSTKFNRKRLSRHPSVVWSRLKLRWPFFVWLLAIGGAWYLYWTSFEISPLVGIVQKTEEFVSPLETARLVSLFVADGDRVTNGQVLARFDTSLIDSQISVEQALTVEDAETVARFQQGMIEMKSAAEKDVVGAESDLSAERRNFAQDAAELKVLEDELRRFQQLVDRQLMDASSISMLKARKAAIERGVELYPEVINSLEARVNKARDHLKQIESLLGSESPVDAIQKKFDARRQIHAMERDRLVAERERYTMRASRTGKVPRILRQAGEVVQAGTPILSIIEEKPDLVVTYLPEPEANTVETNMLATIWHRDFREPSHHAVVEAIAPDIEGLPGRVTPVRGQQVRGQRVLLRLTGESDLIPGETVNIAIHGQRRPGLLNWLRNIGNHAREFASRLTRRRT